MRDIARLLFGPEADRLLTLFEPDPRDESGLAARVRQAGEWCQTTPGAKPSARGAIIRARPGRRGTR